MVFSQVRIFLKIKAKEVQTTYVLSCKKMPVIRVKYYKKDAFIMGFRRRNVEWYHGIIKYNG